MADNQYRIGIDVGGTFTDVVRLNTDTGELDSAKVPTDYADPVAPMLAGIGLFGAGVSGIGSLRHATTLATNAVIENKLPHGVLLTTKGFRDVLDIGRIQRPEAGIYDFDIDNPQPLISRADRLEVVERMDARGDVVIPVDEDKLRHMLRELNSSDIFGISISLLFSFVNPVHEKQVSEVVSEELPGVYVSLSSDVSPEIREFERTSTVVLDALLKPVIAPYLETLEQRITAAGVPSVRIMMASGGLTSCALAASRPVNIVNSGPAAGVLASANLGRALGINALITIDMGGTSLDIGVVENGQPVQKFEGQIAGYPLRVPMIDVSAVAAGGGSLALVDEIGFIQVDRESAGSVPGPACYGRGGTRPTITDADLLLNRLGSDLAGRGGFSLDRVPAAAAFEVEICTHLQIDVPSAAAGVLEIIQARMVKAIAGHTLEQGLDIRALPLLVYGGAGPTHGVELAEAMGMNRAIIPYLAGNFSAVGLMLCPVRWDSAAMVMRPAEDMSDAGLAEVLRKLDSEARERMATTGDEESGLVTHWHAHMRYAGQSYDLAIDLGVPWTARPAENLISALVAEFHTQHERRYAYRSEEETVEIVQIRVSVRGEEMEFPAPAHVQGDGAAVQTGQRDVYFTGVRENRQASVWQRPSLPGGTEIPGPAVIEGEGSSALIPPGWTATVDRFRNLDVRRD
ncbi:MAG: hydantoinase/oxoprolinase family protein [Alphaproteobacteria bacterium]|nr:hydantoinase/oxoprolinase family protein [Alphaproteobacteria bacterium]